MSRVKFFIENYRNYCEFRKPLRRSNAAVLLELCYYRLIKGYNVEEYFRNEFYNFSRSKCLTFISKRNIRRLRAKCNVQSERHIVDYKPDFNNYFDVFLKRDWIDLEKCSEEEFRDFVMTHPESFCKVSDGLQGIGATKLDFHKNSADAFYAEHKGQKLILEELIQQHHEMAEFNASTVNTLRIISFHCADDTVKVLGAALRTGRAGQVADNFHHHGIASTIDVDTGIVVSSGIDNHFRRYVTHPDSGKPFPGFRVPHWDMVIEEVKAAALVVPNVRYIGWDIAVREDDICFVEGNTNAAVDVVEMPLKEGIWIETEICARPFLK